jgi:alkanesulfonate monooxygenase SsuD/methylene tetrahydromethanopterin reductase-like flavin-dependent oxidoreductase (luciferase family)
LVGYLVDPRFRPLGLRDEEKLMSRIIVLALGVGSVADSVQAVGSAEAAGSPIIRIRDQGEGGATLDPSVMASYLGSRFPSANFVVEAATTHNAPYNLARRVLSLDRATGGRAGLALRSGDGDEVSAATTPNPGAFDQAERWAEYAEILTRLWESFPAAALVGDQEEGIFVEDSLIASIDHEGQFYRVAGPLDGPSSQQGRPVLLADADELDWTTLARTADVVVVTAERSADANVELRTALESVGRRREEVALLGRAAVSAADATDETAQRLGEWAGRDGLDGFELVPVGGLTGWNAVVSQLVPLLDPAAAGPTLRDTLRLPEVVEVQR